MTVSVGTIYDPLTMRVIAPCTGGRGVDFGLVPPILEEGSAFLSGWLAPLDHPQDYLVDLSDPTQPGFVFDPRPETDLSTVKTKTFDKIDESAGRARRLIGSPGYAIDATYKAKEEEARRFVAEVAAGGSPEGHLEDYPYIAAGTGIDAATPGDVAALYLAMAREWHAFNASVEAVRIASKQQVAAAESRSEIDTIMATITWPIPAS
ncbi:hypothetical protein [Pseudokordiimonas caeni]|uniref:hypothetical protein n=1 Tax=Pseudokordiimonas caeni TaxID=2997908 RepID=UPI002810EBF6|nr:hypothetical protein [Pseudokordiimonas caeni]